jgi:hypothetical protein
MYQVWGRGGFQGLGRDLPTIKANQVSCPRTHLKVSCPALISPPHRSVLLQRKMPLTQQPPPALTVARDVQLERMITWSLAKRRPAPLLARQRAESDSMLQSDIDDGPGSAADMERAGLNSDESSLFQKQSQKSAQQPLPCSHMSNPAKHCASPFQSERFGWHVERVGSVLGMGSGASDIRQTFKSTIGANRGEDARYRRAQFWHGLKGGGDA